MTDALRVPQAWFTFTGCVLVTAILYWAQPVIVPIAFATIMAFLLTPVVTSLQRWAGRVPGVMAVVLLAVAGPGGGRAALPAEHPREDPGHPGREQRVPREASAHRRTAAGGDPRRARRRGGRASRGGAHRPTWAGGFPS